MSSTVTLRKIAEMTGGELKGKGDIEISFLTTPDKAVPGSISPLWEKKHIPNTAEDAVLLTKPGWLNEGQNGVEVDDPRKALMFLLEYFEEKDDFKPGIDDGAYVSDAAQIGENVYVGPGCIIGEANIGDGTVIYGNVFIGDNVSIGKGTVIEPGVVVFKGSDIGERCIIRANAVIGCEGFGFMPDPQKGLRRIPQIGTVKIEDDVELGAFTSVDRATFGVTLISRGTKIDSHVKIGHNCRLGEFCIIVAQSGLAGTSTLGSGVTMGAQSGVGNHATVASGTVIASRSGVTADIRKKSQVSGFPAQDHRKELRERAAARRYPELAAKVKELSKRIEELEK